MVFSSKTLVLYGIVLHLVVLIEAHLRTPPSVPTNVFMMQPFRLRQTNSYFSKYFNTQANARQFSRQGLQIPNIAKYGMFNHGAFGQQHFTNIPMNGQIFNRRPPINQGSVFSPNISPLVERNIIRVALNTGDSGDDDDESRLNTEMLHLFGSQIFHHVDIRPRIVGTPPPFYLYPSIEGANKPIPSDIIFVIYTSHKLGKTHPTGKAIWHSGIVEFINKFVHTSAIGPDRTRVGAVVIGHLGIESLIPMLSEPSYIFDSLSHIQSSFRGQCSDNGLLVAKNMFYQYGRPYAAKRIILITDDSIGCSFNTMPGMSLARECGIDVIPVRFGSYNDRFVEGVPADMRPYWRVPITGDIANYFPPVADRIQMLPLNGGWSPWSAWNQCSAHGVCNVGYQMRFRICDNPRPSFAGRPCNDFPTETRFCRIGNCTDLSSAYWTPWGSFSPCSSNCGIGTRTRTRMCLTFDGQPSVACAGNYVDTRECAVTDCPVSGGWSPWSGWGICSTSCGAGTQIRSRMCDHPSSRHGGALCQGTSIEETECLAPVPCPIEGGFGPWKKWGRCNVPCGRGFQRYIRHCYSPIPQYGGQTCIGRFEMRRPCDTNVACPIPGGWSSWSMFSQCSVGCGRGVSFRRRVCNAPMPLHRGSNCGGPSVEEHICDTGITCPLDGHWSPWRDNSRCSVSCGIGYIQRIRFCNNPSPMNGGMYCIGSPRDTTPCNAGLTCPVDGGWSTWTAFTPCPVGCETGFMTRQRQCNNPVPDGGSYCVGMDSEQRACESRNNCPTTGLWSEWMEWRPCSVVCDVGTRQRHRLCNNPLLIPNVDFSCVGNPIQEEPCDTGIHCPVHGGWSNWSNPTQCSATCGAGSRQRTRSCNSPSLMYGGRDCVGPNEEFIECKSDTVCPVNGDWSLWTDWQACAGTCGIGIERRTRVCNNPIPMHLGLDCVGDLFEERNCDTGTHCPIDGMWSAWSPWTLCSASCGSGIKRRERQCDSPAPLYGGLTCEGFEKEELMCSAERPCPEHGGWSNWTPFSSCSVSCGQGKITRTRLCENPKPMHGGEVCSGQFLETVACDTQIECPVNGGWSPWTEYSSCPVSCGAGVQERTRECSYPYPSFNGKPCVGEQNERIPCRSPLPCPVHGQWGGWSEFGPCDASCGQGIQRKSRLCNSPAPRFGGNLCPGLSVQEVVCQAPINCPIDGYWSPWSHFSACSQTCGIGVHVRKRLCNNPAPLFNGANCFGAPIEESECHGLPCPIHGGWSNWSPFGQCSASCGKGVKRRFRECTNPPPQNNGLSCNGKPFEELPCNSEVNCPLDGSWSPWSDWLVCDSMCGIGTTRRTRDCSNPPPSFGGRPCNGNNHEVMNCETGIACPIDGGWGQWGGFTPCSTTCGTGMKQRHRNCNTPVPQYKGKFCIDEGFEGIECNNNIPCPVDGGFSFWSEWSMCSADCGEGIQSRARMCNSPSPLHGGQHCVGHLAEERTCLSNIPCPIDGQWGPWSLFTQCGGQCGPGSRERIRACDQPVPLYGGMACQGENINIESCDTGTDCPVDGNWDAWMPWSSCSMTCDVGIQRRERVCSNPKPMFNGKPCAGVSLQEQLCNTGHNCPVNGNWGVWAKWQPCEANCGMGKRIRLRVCDSPSAKYGGMQCVGSNIDETICDSGIPCPTDGFWSSWTHWSSCSMTCGMGIQKRLRTCTNPEPAFGGLLCSGPSNEVTNCDTGMVCPVHGHWTIWSPWASCSTTCGAGTQLRVRECADPIPAFGGMPCDGIGKDVRDCFEHCPIHGNWSPWAYHGPCSASCGFGIQQRIRSCNEPAPIYGGLDCIGPAQDTVDCQIAPCHRDGGWSHWNDWSLCQGTCGIGIRTRLRECTNPLPFNGGKMCVGPDYETGECNTKHPCPVDGHWSPWFRWSKCTGVCGIGQQVRERQCDNPAPLFGGRNCPGVFTDRRDCNTGVPCPIDGQWSHWSIWNGCVGRCGIGQQRRTRMCNNPEPSYGGLTCLGQIEEKLDCNTGIPCPIDGNWAEWSAWTKCDAACGVGAQSKVRYCINPEPLYGGSVCIGSGKKSRFCDSGVPCSIDGNWANWSAWSGCDATCGSGRQVRLRSCTNPEPKFNGRLCSGFPEEGRVCNTGIVCKSEGQWAPWSGWSHCSTDCGSGVQTRSRRCEQVKPSKYELFCIGLNTEKRTCQSTIGCPVNGDWSSWEAWSVCSVSCGKGFVYRYRRCNSPPPRNGGSQCQGHDEETNDCNTLNPCTRPGGWSLWQSWTSCSTSCGTGVQFRKRRCDSPVPMGQGSDCSGWPEDNQVCNTDKACPIHGGWSGWTKFGPCTADCSSGSVNVKGTKTRQRYCERPHPRNGGNPCEGPSLDTLGCNNFPPCPVPEWGRWSKWSSCSRDCGPGVTERKRLCVDKNSGLPTTGCVGVDVQTVQCMDRPCPTTEVNCSTECKWDNGIGYAPYPGDCSKFIQCDSINGIPKIQDCPWGLLWSLEILQCVFPAQSECDVCSTFPEGSIVPYFRTCKSYWICQNGLPSPNCCPEGERFDPFIKRCTPDPMVVCKDSCLPARREDPIPSPSECLFRESALGPTWYEQQEVPEIWIPRPCGLGTVFSRSACGCINPVNASTIWTKKECVPDLHLTFDTLQQDLDRNVGIHMENVTYLGDGTAHFDGTAAINSNIFSNSEWGKDVFVYIRFKPEGDGKNQGLVHNSGCGPSDIGPSVFIGIDRAPDLGPDKMRMKFAAVPKLPGLKYEFVNITAPDNKLIDAWFKFGDSQFRAEVDGLVAELQVPGRPVARRHGALNIGGNLCRIGNEAFGGFHGILDEVRIYKCKPPRR